jgi:hypothetical protein
MFTECSLNVLQETRNQEQKQREGLATAFNTFMVSELEKIKYLTLPHIAVPKVVRNLKATHFPPLD